MAITQTGLAEFVLVGQQARIKLSVATAQPSMYERVEEGRFDGAGKWIMERNWNGDQTDYGLNLPAAPTGLKIRMRTLEH